MVALLRSLITNIVNMVKWTELGLGQACDPEAGGSQSSRLAWAKELGAVSKLKIETGK